MDNNDPKSSFNYFQIKLIMILIYYFNIILVVKIIMISYRYKDRKYKNHYYKGWEKNNHWKRQLLKNKNVMKYRNKKIKKDFKLLLERRVVRPVRSKRYQSHLDKVPYVVLHRKKRNKKWIWKNNVFLFF